MEWEEDLMMPTVFFLLSGGEGEIGVVEAEREEEEIEDFFCFVLILLVFFSG